MKLLKTQYQDIQKVMSEFNIAPERLSMVKKKGRIKIRIEGIDSIFEFFRRKSTILTPDDHQWEKLERYEISINGEVLYLSKWSEVVINLKNWLQDQLNPT